MVFYVEWAQNLWFWCDGMSHGWDSWGQFDFRYAMRRS